MRSLEIRQRYTDFVKRYTGLVPNTLIINTHVLEELRVELQAPPEPSGIISYMGMDVIPTDHRQGFWVGICN